MRLAQSIGNGTMHPAGDNTQSFQPWHQAIIHSYTFFSNCNSRNQPHLDDGFLQCPLFPHGASGAPHDAGGGTWRSSAAIWTQ
jgi:hypothetical protein